MARPWDAGSLLAWAAALTVTGVFCWLLGDLLWNGVSGINWAFLTEAPRMAGREGGIAPILVSTGLILAVCMGVSVPLGLGSAVFLSELTTLDSRSGRFLRRSLDVLSGVPSIVFGLFGNVFFCVYLGLGFSILSGGLTLACMVLPILIRATEEGLRAVPQSTRLGAAALGMSRTRSLWALLLPAALPSLLVGLALGVGRAIAETAALVFTSGYVDRMPESLMDSGRALSIHIFDLSMNISGGESSAYAAAVVLVAMLLMINLCTSGMAHRWRHHNESLCH